LAIGVEKLDIANLDWFCFPWSIDLTVFARSHGKEKGANYHVSHMFQNWILMGETFCGNQPEVVWGDGFFSMDSWVLIVPCMEYVADGGFETVGAVRFVKGARPVITPEFRSQVANGLLERPSENRLEIIWLKGTWSCSVGEVSVPQALEKGVDDGKFVSVWESVKEDVISQSQVLEE
jgi:hypothetical protein